MTCYVDPTSGDVYDHTGSKVGNLDGTGWGHSWSGDFPRKALDVLYDALDSDKPSGYNQQLIAEMAAEQIEMGTP